MFKSEPTIRFDIYMAGDIAQAKQVCRVFCEDGLCVHIEPVDYIYKGGQEIGFKVGLLNYPRFPNYIEELHKLAHLLGDELRSALCQDSYLIVGPTHTEWFSRRDA